MIVDKDEHNLKAITNTSVSVWNSDGSKRVQPSNVEALIPVTDVSTSTVVTSRR